MKHCLADIILTEMKNPELKLISVSEVIVSDDLKKAKILISFSNDNIDDVMQKLEKAKGFVKKSLAKRMYLKYVPDLVFSRDSTYELNQKISDLNRRSCEKENCTKNKRVGKNSN